MPNTTARHDADEDVSRPDRDHAMRLVDPRYRTMTTEEDRAAVAAVAALIRALARAGHRPFAGVAPDDAGA